MKYAKITNGIVTQIQPNSETGFVQVPDNTICGMVQQTDGTFISSTSLADIKIAKISELNLSCEQTIISGFPSSALGTEHYYQSDRDDQTNLLGLVVAGQDSILKCGVLQTDGTILWTFDTPHTIGEIQQVFSAGATYKMEQLQKCNTLKQQVNSATTEADIDLIVW